nr:uncharacterized protein LOC109156681 [Ipomoea batatas]
MAKAYDWVFEFFLILIMRKMGFSKTKLDLVFKIISNIWYSVVTNVFDIYIYMVMHGKDKSRTVVSRSFAYNVRDLQYNSTHGSLGIFPPMNSAVHCWLMKTFKLSFARIVESKRGASSTGRRLSQRLAEQARLEELESKRAAQGGLMAGDSPKDPLVVLFEEEEGAIVP